MISRTDKYGKWSDMALRTMPEYSALFISFNRQNIWSINVADILMWCFRVLLAERCDCTLDILVGYMICGKKAVCYKQIKICLELLSFVNQIYMQFLSQIDPTLMHIRTKSWVEASLLVSHHACQVAVDRNQIRRYNFHDTTFEFINRTFCLISMRTRGVIPAVLSMNPTHEQRCCDVTVIATDIRRKKIIITMQRCD